MTKILLIIIIIIIFAGGGWYYKNNMKTPSEGTPVGYESGKGDKKGDKEDRYNNKFDNKSFAVTFPKGGAILDVGQKINTTWNTGKSFNLKLTYPVILVNVTDKTKKPILLGTAKNSLFNKVFTWTVPQDITPGNSYKLVFVGKQGGESQSFIITTPEGVAATSTTPTTPVNNPGPAVFSKVSSTITTIKNNNVDTGVSASFRLNVQANKSDIYANGDFGISATIVLTDIATGKTFTPYLVGGVTDSGLVYFPDGAVKPLTFNVVFPASIFPSGGSNVKASIYSITYKTVGTTVSSSTSYSSLNFSSYDTGVTSIMGTGTSTSTSTIVSFTRNLIIGDTGADATALQKILLA